MKRLVAFSLLTAFALSSCAGPESDWFYGDLKPKMESHLRYMLTPDEISDDAVPEEYFETGEYDYAVEETVSAIQEYFNEKIIDFTELGDKESQKDIESYVCDKPFYEELSSRERRISKKTINTFCNYTAAEVAKTPTRTLIQPEYTRTEGSTEYYNVTCSETGKVYEIWVNVIISNFGKITTYGYSLTPVEH